MGRSDNRLPHGAVPAASSETAGRRRLSFLAAAALLLVAGSGWAYITVLQAAPAAEASPGPRMVADTGGTSRLDIFAAELDESTRGFLEPVRRTLVGAPTYGRITELLVKEGDPVKEGDVLVQLDDRRRQLEYELANFDAENTAEVDHARVSAQYRLAEYERQYTYYHSSETPMISESELEGYRLQSDLAKAVLRLREAELDRRKKLVALSDYDLENTRIRAPFAGVVTRKDAEVGRVAELGTPLLELIDTHQLYFVIKTFPASRLRDIAVGQEVLVTPLVFPEYERRGRVELIGPETDQASQTLRIKVLVENADGKLCAGLEARATFLPPAEGAGSEAHTTPQGARK